jgi:hypothetical protein
MTQKISLRLLAIIIFSVSFIQLTGCKKDAEIITTPATPVCDVKGTYSGTNLASTGASSTLTYKLQDNNFAVGSVTPTGAAVTFGGYRNTCDSVILSVYYAGNSSYYLLQGKLLNNGTTISGSFKNLTTPSDFGTFSISK